MDCPIQNEDNDPDYVEFHAKETVDRSKLQEDDSKGETLKKINTILLQQFNDELTFKVKEVNIINDRIRNVQYMLDRLRAYITASYYGSGEKLVPMSRSVDNCRKRKYISNMKEDDTTVMPVNTLFNEKLKSGEINLPESLDIDENENLDKIPECKPISNVVNRFYVNKKIIVGNISKYLLTDSRKENDKSTHKWMVYCRGPQEEPDVSYYVKSVWFFLHPSYIPNDIVQVNRPPFQIIRRGWGEFPVRVQIHFKDGRNKRFDIIHHLKLDKTYTGLQTLGAETVVNLELHRHAVSTNDILVNNIRQSNMPCSDTKTEQNSMKIGSTAQSNTVKLESGIVSEHLKDNPSLSSITNPFDEPISSCTQMLSRSNSLTHSTALSEKLMTPSVLSSCVTSASISRCNSPELKMRKDFEIFPITDEQDLILRKLTPSFPLIKPGDQHSTEGYTCDNIELFKSWSFSKRRACEWQRAVHIRRALIENNNLATDSNTPTTKQILKWCRYNCYTPCESNFQIVDNTSDSSLTFCQFCGTFQSQTLDDQSQLCQSCVKNLNEPFAISTKTPFSLVYGEIENKEKTVACLKELNMNSANKQDDSETFIDILNVPKTNTKLNPTNIRFEVPKTEETEWISETCREIGVDMTSSIHKSVKGPFSSMVLCAAVKNFITELLRRSNTNVVMRNRYSFSPGLVTVNSMCKTIIHTKRFDFLQDIGLGKYISDGVKKKEK